MAKIVVRDIVDVGYEPYDRQYMLGIVAGYCQRNPSILRNPGMVTLPGYGYKSHRERWDDHQKPVHYVAFDVVGNLPAAMQFLKTAIGRWAVKLEVVSQETETTLHR